MTKQEAMTRFNSMTVEERKQRHLKICPRCGGSGKYSFCTMYGDTCFKCNGLGIVKDYRLGKRKNKEVNA